MAKELQIPEAVFAGPKALELARVWAAGGKQHVSLKVALWPDPFSWGIMLADLLQHVANAYAQDESRDRESVVARIREGFLAELDRPTDSPTGKVLS